jgi:hypothetical protein
MSRRQRTAAVLATLAAALLAAPPGAAQEASPYGVNVHAPAGADLVRQLDLVEAAGIGWIRIDFVWAAIEVRRGHHDWRLYDELVAAAERRGLAILGIIAFTPDWATDGPPLTGVPRDVDDWRRFCAAAANRYRDTIRTWEVWNEPNLDRFWAGTREEYWERILIPAADAIHGASPDARVAGPALAHLQSADWHHWLLATLERAGDRLDVVTHHVYDRDGYRDLTRKLTGSTTFADDPRFWDIVAPSVREVLKEAGVYPDKPFWLTETGWESAARGEAAQLDDYLGFLRDWFTGHEQRSWIDKVFFYELQDPPQEFTWGLLRPDGSAKSAYHAYRAFVAAWPAEERRLTLGDGRYSVGVSWRNQRDGTSGSGEPVGFSTESGVFWFFAPDRVELVVKILDGGPVNGRSWVFFGSLSDVEYWVTVTDHLTARTRRYHNRPGTICGRADVAAFPAAPGAAAAGVLPDWLAAAAPAPAAVSPLLPAVVTNGAGTCVGDAEALCLGGGRFLVEARWRNPRDGGEGTARAVGGAGESGYFWFFDPENLELAVKVVDGRGTNGFHWVFFAALSDVEYWIDVTDTLTGVHRGYHNPPYTYCGQAHTEEFE